FDNFFTAQVLWDETMAEKIALFAQANPDYQVVVIAGQGHIIYGYGIPSRVARRFNNQLEQISVLLGVQSEKLAGENAIADYLWEHLF
ncbi:MAG: ChaN family lipoprotein, partial [Moorea sp. SIO3I7]|nr:ChaN family lipoprotein [Moorena sp. SIO3I7]